MLPAVSADLPAYVAGPQRPPDSRRTATDGSAFGPPVQVDLSTDQAVDAQSQTPGTSLYGPDGRFVESSARREVLSDAEANHQRNLALAELDAIIPPAAREELRALADRVGRAATRQQSEPRQLKQIARLMDRVGRYEEAHRALAKAQKLEGARQDDATAEPPSVPDAARPSVEATEQQN